MTSGDKETMKRTQLRDLVPDSPESDKPDLEQRDDEFALASGAVPEMSDTQGCADLAQTTGGQLAGLPGDK